MEERLMKKPQADEDEDYMLLMSLHITYNKQTENKKSFVAISLHRHVRLNITTRACDVYPDKCWFAVLCRFWLQCSRGLRRGSAAALFLGLRIRIPPGNECLSLVSIVCCQI